jgi:ribose transport system ATP-binding protein
MVLRDGKNAGLLERDEISHDSMVRLMVGRDLEKMRRRRAAVRGKMVLETRELCTPDNPAHPLSFSIRAGEIVGIAGLVGAGRTELLQVLFGVKRPVSGKIILSGKDVCFHSPGAAIGKGISLVPEDRKKQGLIVRMNVRENIGLAGIFHNRVAVCFHNQKVEKKNSDMMVKQLDIRISDDRQITENLSGGNQQKLVLAKWLSLNPGVLLMDEPTKGVDVKAKREIYGIMEKLADRGTAILFVSSEMEEVLSVSDRVLVMCEGRITGELSRDELSEEAVMRLATGK